MYLMDFRLFIITFSLPFIMSRLNDFTNLKRNSGVRPRQDTKQGRYVPKPGIRLQKPSSSSLSVASYDSTILECEAEGNPSPIFHWLKDGQRILQGSWDDLVSTLDEEMNGNEKITQGVSRTRSRLFLDCVTAKQEGVYSCVAENPYQRISGETVVKLSKEGNTVNALCMAKKSFGTPARIYMWTRTRIEVQGNDIQLFCRASGNPQPKLAWMRGDENGKLIESSEKYKILESGDLVIRNLAWEDLGGYTCLAKNVHGNDKTFTFVYPAAPEKE
ncbi:zwei Ig domain protein zig-4-like [Tachypleus tridentatus]|uniref:zwei Ig domain protein zig-4-like n=1 Tax=Tachypleus tridentatus TaxID=6853 RepID=UPI003FD4A78C